MGGDIAVSGTTDGAAGRDAQLEKDATNSDSEASTCASSFEGKEIKGRVLHVQATLPQDLHFIVPSGCVPGQLVTVQGPHGPLQVQAPPVQHEVFVPAGAQPGQKVTF